MTVQVPEQYDFNQLAWKVRDLQESLAALRRAVDSLIAIKNQEAEKCRDG
jgi:hypothetical protein